MARTGLGAKPAAGTARSSESGDAPTPNERRAAFAELARQYEAALLRAALRMFRGDRDRAQDLLQDTFIRAYQAYLDGRFEPGTNARAWLFRILTNGFLYQYRQSSRRFHVSLDEVTPPEGTCPGELRAGAADGPGTALLENTLDEELERALAVLSEEHRLCVLLVDIEDLEYVEAAALLKIPVGTLRSRLARARLRLHALLAGSETARRRQ
jgi:RNA polymerase sigma-70 factor, ECF subfamily